MNRRIICSVWKHWLLSPFLVYRIPPASPGSTIKAQYSLHRVDDTGYGISVPMAAAEGAACRRPTSTGWGRRHDLLFPSTPAELHAGPAAMQDRTYSERCV